MTTPTKDHEKKDKLHEALELLNEAAKEKKAEVYGVINTKYEHLREMFTEVSENSQAFAEDAKKNISKALSTEEKKLKELARQLDKEVRKNPWAYIGGAALGSLCLGLLLSRKKKPTQIFMKLRNIWFVTELLGAFGLLQRYKQNTQEWVRIQTAMLWLKGIHFARDLIIYQVGIAACVLVLVCSAILMEAAFIFFIPVSLKSKIITIFALNAVNFAVAFCFLRYFLSSECWLKQAAKYNDCVSELAQKTDFKN